MNKDFDFLDEINKVMQPREKTNLEKALELAEQLKTKIDKMDPSNKTQR